MGTRRAWQRHSASNPMPTPEAPSFNSSLCVQSPEISAQHHAASNQKWSIRGKLCSFFKNQVAVDADDVPTHCALLPGGAVPPKCTSARGLGERKVAIFGLTPDGERAAESPVVVKTVPVEAPDQACRVELREIGLRFAGSYRIVEQAFDTNAYLMEWLPSGCVEERAKPLDVVLEGITHVRMYPPSRACDSDEVVEVSLTHAHNCWAPSLSYHIIPSACRDSASPEGGFKRCFVQVGWRGMLDFPQAILTAERAGLKGFVETGEVLAQALALRFRCGEGCGRELAMQLQMVPRLLYFASIALLEAALGPLVRQVLREHWEQQLQLSVVGKFPMATEEREARCIMRDLLLARPAESVDRTCAVIPKGHLSEIHDMLRRTKHPHRTLSMECLNFEARTREVESMLADATLTFLIVHITGAMSPLQLASLLQLGRGCLRLLLVDYPGLLPSLASARVQGRVLLPASLDGERQRRRPLEYRPGTAVGAAVLGAGELFAGEPRALARDHEGLPWEENWSCLEAELKLWDSWRQEVDRWRGSSEPFLHLVTPDHEPVLAYLTGSGDLVFDADESSNMGALPVSNLLSRLQPCKDAALTDAAAFVLLNHNLLPKAKLEDMAAQCLASGTKLVLVAAELPVALRSLRVHKTGRSAVHMQVPVVFVRLALEDLLQQAEVEPHVLQLLAALRLLFGPKHLTGMWARAAARAEGESDWQEVARGLAGNSAPQGEVAAAQELLKALQGQETGSSLTALVASTVLSGVQQHNVAFAEFVRMPMCRFLPQSQRLEAWLRYLDPSLNTEDTKMTGFEIPENCHSAELLPLLAKTKDMCTGSSPTPSYYVVGHDAVLSDWQAQMQAAAQGRDLDWEALTGSWGTRKSLDTKETAALMEVSLDSMKLALCAPPSLLLRMRDALATTGGPVPLALSRLRKHFRATAPLLLQAARALPASVGVDAILDRLAALKFVFHSLDIGGCREAAENEGEGNADAEDITSDDLQRLLRHHLPLSAGPQSAPWLRLLLALDEPKEALVEQTEVRQYLLNVAAPSGMVDLGNTPLGAVFTTFLAVSQLRQVLSKESPVKALPFLSGLVSWLNGEEVLCREALAQGADLLSAAGFATLLVHAPTTLSLRQLVRHSVWPGCRAASKRAAVLNALAREKGAEHLVVPALEELVECERWNLFEDDDSDDFGAALELPFCAALHEALWMQDLGPYLALEEAPPLPLDTAPKLLTMYVDHFRRRPADATSDVHHFRRLKPPSCMAIAAHAAVDSEAPRLLLWHCWARDPSVVLPSTQLPQCEKEHAVFLAALTSTDFRRHAMDSTYGLSDAARMILKPHTMPLAVFNLFAPLLSWIHGPPPSGIEEKLLVIAQEGNSDYPPYCLRWHYRPLPLPLKETLLAAVRGKVRPLEGDLSLQSLYPKITEGVSAETFLHNLSLLFTLMQTPASECATFHGFHKSMLAACILVWFRAQDVNEMELQSCIVPELRADFEMAWQNLGSTQTDEMRSKCAAGPLPTYIDTHWLEPGRSARGHLFMVTVHSAQLTAQWLNNLCVHAGLDVQPFQTSDLVVLTGPRGHDEQKGPRFDGALESVARAWGMQVAGRLFEAGLVLQGAPGSLESSGLTRHFALLADFCQLLRGQQDCLQALFDHFAAGFAEGVQGLGDDVDKDRRSAAVYDVFFLLFGASPENGCLEMYLLTAAFRQHGLKGSKQAITEMEWLQRNFYNDGDEARRNLTKLLSLNVGVHPMKRYFKHAVPITHYSAPGVVEGGLHVDPPSYLQPQHFPLCLDGKETPPAPREGKMDTPGSPESGAEAACFFTSCKDGSSATQTNCKRELVKALPEAGRATIAAAGLLKMETSTNYHLYACLKVAPGLQPLLYQEAPDCAVYRLTSAETARDQRKVSANGRLSRVFSSNEEAWRYVDELAPHTTLMANGFYLTKADDGTWVPILASSRAAAAGFRKGIVWSGEGNYRIMDQKLCLWPFVHSADLVSLDLDPSVRHLAELVVVLAFQLAEGSTAEELKALPCQVEKEKLCILSAALGKISRASVAIEAGSCDDQNLCTWLAIYQRQERGICACLREALKEVARQGATGDLVGILAEACRKLGGDGMPFVQDGPAGPEPADLGIYLAQHLAVVSCKLDPGPRRQLRALLARATAGAGQLDPAAGSGKKVVQHHRITLQSFERQSLDVLARLAQAPVGAELWRYDEGFTDSEEESDSGEADPFLSDLVIVPNPSARNDAAEAMGKFVKVDKEVIYPDAAFDRDGEHGACLFSRPTGFGRPLHSKFVVMSFFDTDCPLYYVGLDAGRLKLRYCMEEGLLLGYMLHKRLIAGLLEAALRFEGGLEAMFALRGRLLAWLADVLRSPISDSLKSWILRKVELQGRNAETPPASNVNSLVIAYSLCSCCPNSTKEAQFLRHVLMQSLTSAVEGVTPTIEKFIRRKEQYGIYIVKGGTLFELQGLFGQENVSICDYEREVSQRSVSINWLYLDIIKRFRGFTSVVYVQGMQTIEDALLKWLAEYTRYHAWRYVFLENVDTSWNYSENRDRCNFSFAPESVCSSVRSTADLLSPQAASVLPSHVVEYQCCPASELRREPSGLLALFRRELPCPFLRELPRSRMVGDFRLELRALLGGAEPCVVLVVSPPGAGKTFFMDDLRARLESEERAVIVQFDGSSDILVTHTISELLDQAVALQGERVLLILDEYHMLAEAQKSQLFDWMEERAAGLQVVLVANRIDSKDRERIKACALDARLVETRLSRAVLDEKLSLSGVPKALWPRVRLWHVAARLVFGEESISLRLVEPIAAALSSADPRRGLRDVLLSKVPTISTLSADHFVAAFLCRSGGSACPNGPFATLFTVAAQDEVNDSACSYHEFVSRMPRGLLSMAPPVRLLCWSAYIFALHHDHSLVQTHKISLSNLLDYEYVDQVGTPFQLCTPSSGQQSKGRAFSWCGDYENIDGIIDAVKRGFSVNWREVHDKHWQHCTITESEKVCQLLSCCRNPSACLEAFTADNLMFLLRSACPEDAVTIARCVLQNNAHHQSSKALFQQALWVMILHDDSVISPGQLAELTDGVGPTGHGESPSLPRLLACLEWAREHAGDKRQVKSCLDVRQREGLLQQALVMATMHGGACAGRQSRLWSGLFAPLLVIPTEESEAEWSHSRESWSLEKALPVDVLRAWLHECDAFDREWPLEVRNLWSVMHCKAPASVVDRLWSRNRTLLCEPLSERFASSVVAGILKHEGGELDKELQWGFLTNGCKIPPQVADDDLHRVLHAALRLAEQTGLPSGMDVRLANLVMRRRP